MSSRLFIAKSPSLSDLEAFVADLVLTAGGSSLGSPLQILKAKCRELARAESAIIVCPTPYASITHSSPIGQLSLWIVAKKDSLKGTKIVERFKQLGIRVCSKIAASIKVVQSCYQFTIIARLAPKWNQITDWIIKGSEFLTTSRAQAIKLEVGITETEVTLNVIINKLVFYPLKPEDLNPPCTVLQSFCSKQDFVIQETSIYNNRCVLLPNLSNGYIYSASHQLPSSQHRDTPFQSYNQIRLHWKKQYGILLPEEQGLFYQVYFSMKPTQFFTYPGCCVLKAHPTSYPSREADPVTAAFIADIHSRVPGLCGTALRYSSKAFTPTVGLQPVTAIGVETTSRAVNLKPGSLPKPAPKANLRYYPTSPPSMLSSQPAHTRVHVANLPTHSASLGAQPSKPPPKKRPKFDTLASDSVTQSQNAPRTTLAQPESAATPTASASTRPGLGLPASAIATTTQPRQSTTTSNVRNVPSPMEAALDSSESSRKETASVSDTIRHRISVCSNAVLKKWLVENGVQCRARERKEVLIRLVTQHVQHTGKTFNL